MRPVLHRRWWWDTTTTMAFDQSRFTVQFLRASVLAAAMVCLTASLAFTAAPALAAEEVGSPQPEALVMTRVCEQGGALVVMNNYGGGSVTFSVLVNNEASGSFPVGPGAQATQLVPIAEGQTVAIQVTADGMAPMAATRTRDCDGEAVAGAAEGPDGSGSQGATDPVDEVPAGTPPPADAAAVAGAADEPVDSMTAPATDPVGSGTLPFTGSGALSMLGLLGLALIAAGSMLRRAAARD